MNGDLVIVADDTETNVFVLRAMLKSFGLGCRVARDGVEAVEMVASAPPKLVLMDINMPRLNGMEAARQIRSQYSGERVIIVAVTAHPDSRSLPEYARANFDDFLIKPVDMAALKSMISRYLGMGDDAAQP